MIKELVLKYGNVAFKCRSNKQYLDFINIATSEMKFSKTLHNNPECIYRQTKKIILEDHTKHNQNIALIVTKELENKVEFQYYSRSEKDIYDDWNKYKIIDFEVIQRNKKLKKLNEVYKNF